MARPRHDEPPALWLVDAHVHLHEIFDVGAFLDAAARNVAREASRLGRDGEAAGLMVMTDGAGGRGFRRLAEAGAAGWRVTLTDEPSALLARRPGAPLLAAVAGRQIISLEGIEALALGEAPPIPDGLPIAETLDAIMAAGAAAALPWGFGKWIGGRGATVRRMVDDVGRFPRLFLGDSGARALLTPRPPLFERAERKGRAVLPGTDPLPFAAEIAKPCRYGFLMEELDAAAPATSLRRRLEALKGSPRPYGRLERPHLFLARQIAMQLRRRGVPAPHGDAAGVTRS